MDFTNLREHYHKLLDYLAREDYTKSYIRRVKENVLWILRNEKDKPWRTYLDVYQYRVQKPYTKLYQKNLRQAFSAIQQFDLYGEYPNRRPKNCLIKRGAYHQLNPEFKEIINYYMNSVKVKHLKKSTVEGNASGAASFLLAMQKRGMLSLDSINEKGAISFFLDDDGNVSKCSSYKKQIAAVFKVVADWKENECRLLLAYLPQIRPKRKNIQVLKPKEVELIRAAIYNENSELSLRDRAIGKLLFFTGIRACDIADMKLDSVNWEIEEIYLSQQKTNQPLVLPLTVTVGNSIYDYLANERPESNDDHLFLGELYPHYPFEAGAVWHQSAKIYKCAEIRQNKGDRRGTHLFRHNVATSFLGSGIPRPVISQTLGHTDPLLLEAYLHADFVHLKICALSIEDLPVNEEVFCI